MPRIDDKTIAEKRPFKKKPYRPWNLLGTDDLLPVIEKPIIENTGNQLVTNKVPESKQIEINQISNSIQKETYLESINNQKDTKSVNIVNKIESNSNLISNQLVNKKNIKSSYKIIDRSTYEEIQRVSGLQRKILFYIVEDCILRGELNTNPITMECLKMLTNADKHTLKTATQRLVNKSLIKRGNGKQGKGGFAIFYITDEIRNAVIDAKKREALDTALVTKKESIITYSSSSLRTTTTEKKNNEELYTESDSLWENVDINPLKEIGFTKTHLRQIIIDDKLSMDIIQDSIYAFSFDLKKNDKERALKGSPLNYFMGILRSGKPYAPPANYESPQDEALRIYIERKKEIELKRNHMEEELFQVAYKEWEANLTITDKESLLPDNVKNSHFTAEKIAFIRVYFKENIWPTLKVKHYENIKET
jgi:hypothetical protein